MKALLLVAHGSRREQSNNEIAALAKRLEALAAGGFDCVGYAFLERATPGIGDQVRAYAARGIRQIVVFPYLLAMGQHVATDIPACLAQLKVEFPEIDICLTPHVGAARGMPALILEQVETAAAASIV
jgi:sirohydrochlorin ferrochelatase